MTTSRAGSSDSVPSGVEWVARLFTWLGGAVGTAAVAGCRSGPPAPRGAASGCRVRRPLCRRDHDPRRGAEGVLRAGAARCRQRDPPAALVLVPEQPCRDGGRALRRARAPARRASRVEGAGSRLACCGGARRDRDRDEPDPPERPFRLGRGGGIRGRARVDRLLRTRAGRRRSPVAGASRAAARIDRWPTRRTNRSRICSRSSEPSSTGFVSTFDPAQLTARQQELEEAMGAPGFWDDQQQAAQISTEHARVTRRLDGYRRLSGEVEEAAELFEMDPSLEDELRGAARADRRRALTAAGRRALQRHLRRG